MSDYKLNRSLISQIEVAERKAKQQIDIANAAKKTLLEQNGWSIGEVQKPPVTVFVCSKGKAEYVKLDDALTYEKYSSTPLPIDVDYQRVIY